MTVSPRPPSPLSTCAARTSPLPAKAACALHFPCPVLTPTLPVSSCRVWPSGGRRARRPARTWSGHPIERSWPLRTWPLRISVLYSSPTYLPGREQPRPACTVPARVYSRHTTYQATHRSTRLLHTIYSAIYSSASLPDRSRLFLATPGRASTPASRAAAACSGHLRSRQSCAALSSTPPSWYLFNT